jgi:putative transposase
MYFITICTHGRQGLFGHVANGRMILNAFGQIVEDEWLKTARLRPNVELDMFVTMPNHFHGVLVIETSPQETNGRVGARRALPGEAALSNTPVATSGQPLPNTVGVIVGSFKSAVAREINRRRRTEGAPVWQRNYFEKIVRNEQMLNAIRQYIEANPANWDKDEYYGTQL